MKIRYKIYILLSCTYHKFINDKIEIKISQLIKDSINANSIKTDKSIQYKKLILNKMSKNLPFIESVRTLVYILSIRGLTRTLLSFIQPISETVEYNTISRFSILSKIVIHPKIFKSQFLDRLSFEFKAFEEYSSYPTFPSTQLLNENVIAQFVDGINLAFEKPVYKKYVFNFNKNLSDNTDVFIDVFVRWNSKFLIIFVLRNHLYDFVKEFLHHHYPPVLNELKRIMFIQFEDHSLSNMKLDDLYLKKGFNGYELILNSVILHQKFIKVRENILNLDSTSSVKQKFVAGQWAYTNRVYRDQDLTAFVMPDNNLSSLSEGIYLIGRCDENWYHFLLDTLPRLLFFESIPIDVPLLIRSDIPRTTKEFISKLANRKIIEIEPNTQIKVAKLYVCPGRSTVYDVKPPKHVNWVEFSPLVFSKLKVKIINALADESSTSILKSILISRNSSKRNLLNAKSIENVSFEHHIPVYELDQDFIRNQIQIFANTNHVISPGGAALANILFMKPGSKVTVLRSRRYNKLNIWKQLAEINKVEYSEIRGIPSYWGLNFLRRLHSNFYISPRKLRRIISEDI